VTFALRATHANGNPLEIDLKIGQILFVLGANGSGKSALLQNLFSAGGADARRISANRQNWFRSSVSAYSPMQKVQIEENIKNWDSVPNSRWAEQNPFERPAITLHRLMDAKNEADSAIAHAVRSGDNRSAQELAQKPAPIAKLNELLALANITVRISLENNGTFWATKEGGRRYAVAELPDGERNALLIAAEVLTARPGTLLIIDEPERHLHRSIISPLLTELFRYRDDCAFIIRTHDLTLPVDNPEALILLLRSCTFSEQDGWKWDFDLIQNNVEIDESIKQHIVGSGRKIVFVEGEASSLDRRLYRILFPNVSVISNGSSRNVEHAVRGIRASDKLHWVKAWGVIDNDGRDPESIIALRSDGIFVLPFCSVASVYYHPELILAIARRQASVTGGDGDAAAQCAIQAAITSTDIHFSRLASRAVEKSIRQTILNSMPTINQIVA
jgi:ABC-type cobalamin/Fe3+-siderophores transport system ATPase subunit